MSRSNNSHENDPAVVDWQERTWLAAHLKGDTQAFAQLMQAYRKPVYSFLVRNGLEASQRDDVFQEVFLKIHKAAHSYQPNRPLSPWIFTIVVNTLRNLKRQRQVTTLDMAQATEVADEAPSPDNVAQMDETIDWLTQAMGELPPAQAEVLSLSTIQGLKVKEVSEVLGLPLNTIKTQLRRARQSLLQKLKRQQTHRQGVSHERL